MKRYRGAVVEAEPMDFETAQELGITAGAMYYDNPKGFRVYHPRLDYEFWMTKEDFSNKFYLDDGSAYFGIERAVELLEEGHRVCNKEWENTAFIQKVGYNIRYFTNELDCASIVWKASYNELALKSYRLVR